MAEPLDAHGSSTSWSSQRKNHLRIFERFRTSSPEVTALYPTEWEQLDEAILCPIKLDDCVYARFAKYLLDTYLIEAPHKNAGQHLGYAVMIKVLSGMLNHAATALLTATTATRSASSTASIRRPTPRRRGGFAG